MTELMALVCELQQILGKAPGSYWTVDLDGGWTLLVNATATKYDWLPPYTAAVMHSSGMPVAVFGHNNGAIVGGLDAEVRSIEALRAKIQQLFEAVR